MNRSLGFALGVLLIPAAAWGKTITVGPADGYAPVEAAVAGDVVEFQPGVYRYRLSLENDGTASMPITLKAQNPDDRPIFEPAGTVGDAPGSYTAGDRHRGCWQFRGGHYRVDGIVFRNCIDHGSAGIRVVNVPDIQIRNSTFVGNTNGLTGAGEDLVVEHCEFDRNGDALAGDQPAHQMYIFGGTLQVRYSYIHDSPRGQSFHIRARDAVFEYNWITRPGSYMGDLMSCEFLCGGTGESPITQKMLLRGNVIVQGMPANRSQLIALFNDEGPSDDGTGSVARMELTMVYNTIRGTVSNNNSVAHQLNDSVHTAVVFSNNVVTDFKHVTEDEPGGMFSSSCTGQNNWLSAGTTTGGTTGAILGADPMLSPAQVPLPGSPLIGKAADLGALAPTFEYHLDETTTRQGRARMAALDIGARESTTNSPPFGPNAAPPPDGGTGGEGGGGGNGGGGGSGGTGGTGGSGGNDNGAGAGCGCHTSGNAPLGGTFLLLLTALLLLRGGAARRGRR